VAEILVSDEVRALLGNEAVERFGAVSLDGGQCPVCREEILAAGPATMVVLCTSTVTYVRYAHPVCSASTVHQVPDDAVAAAGPDDGLRMDMTAGLVQHGGAVLPVLVAELRAQVLATPGPDGELTDLMLSGLLERGWVLVGRLREAPRRVPGWSVHIGPGPGDDVQVLITDAEGVEFYTGTAWLPDGWRPAVERYGFCVLYAGPSGVGDMDLADQDARLKALRSAAGNGMLVGARAPVMWQE
jgi:hypothetical protein